MKFFNEKIGRHITTDNLQQISGYTLRQILKVLNLDCYYDIRFSDDESLMRKAVVDGVYPDICIRVADYSRGLHKKMNFSFWPEEIIR